jgi:hypothetical protein
MAKNARDGQTYSKEERKKEMNEKERIKPYFHS